MTSRGDKREPILEAAVRVFAQHGFHQSRVADIAREAGVADGTIYLYFRHKEDILIAIFEEKMGSMIRGVRETVGRLEDPIEQLQCFIELHLNQLTHNIPLSEILQIELRLSHKFMKEYVPTRLGEYLEILSDILANGQRKGVFRPEVNPSILKRAIFGALDELAMYWVLTRGRRPDLKESAAQLTDVFFRGLCLPGSVQTGKSDVFSGVDG